MAETIFCILDEQRKRIYHDLRGIDQVRTVLSRRDLESEKFAAELKTYTESITKLLDRLPLDPRCRECS